MQKSEETFVILDDNESILKTLNTIFENENYNLFTTSSIEEAYDFLKYNKVQVFISDQCMPEKKGIEILEEIRNQYPDIVRVIISGNSDIADLVDAINKGGIYRFIKKPWDSSAELKVTIRQCFAHYYKLMNHKELFEKVAFENEVLKKLVTESEQLNQTQVFTINLCKEILSRIPIPLILLDDCKNIIFINEHAYKTKFFSNSHINRRIDELFPEQIILELKKVYTEGSKSSSLKCNLDNKEYMFFIQMFTTEKENVKNCMVLFNDSNLTNLGSIFKGSVK